MAVLAVSSHDYEPWVHTLKESLQAADQTWSLRLGRS